MGSGELKQILRELIDVAKPLCIAYELTHGRVPTGAGKENPQPSTHFENHPDSPFGFGCGAGSPKAPREEKKVG